MDYNKIMYDADPFPRPAVTPEETAAFLTRDFPALLADGIAPAHPALRLVYLFGSYAGGNAAASSDIDLGVLLERTATRSQDTETIRASLVHAINVALKGAGPDVVWLDRAPVELAFEIIRRGRLLYVFDEETRVEYEANVMSRYADYAPILKEWNRQILAGGERERRTERHRQALGRTERTLDEIAGARRTSQAGV